MWYIVHMHVHACAHACTHTHTPTFIYQRAKLNYKAVIRVILFQNCTLYEETKLEYIKSVIIAPLIVLLVL